MVCSIVLSALKARIENYMKALDIESRLPHGESSGCINEIKLRDLLQAYAEEFGLRSYQAMFPPVEIGSITLVDQVVLISLLDMIRPRNILEIGTFKGYTTRLLLENSDIQSSLASVDLPRDATQGIAEKSLEGALKDGNYNDDFLRIRQRDDGEVYLKDLSAENLARLNLIKVDSTKIDYSDYFSSLEYAFIDGGHDYNTVKTDTEKVLDVLTEGVILWHDYSSGIHSDVTTYLQDICADMNIYHVKGSLLAFTLR